MPGEVFFSDLRTKMNHNLLDKIRSLMEALEPGKRIKKRGLTAIKIHFGERGNTSFIRPLLVRPVVDVVVKAGGKPFLTDANTLYVGSRGNAVDHLNTALLNGFSPSVVGAPLIIADGIDGKDETAVRVDLKHFDQVYIGTAVAQAPNLISLAHFKLHEMSGFGGAIKNVGMGAASRRGKMAQHCDVAPIVKRQAVRGLRRLPGSLRAWRHRADRSRGKDRSGCKTRQESGSQETGPDQSGALCRLRRVHSYLPQRSHPDRLGKGSSAFHGTDGGIHGRRPQGEGKSLPVS